MDERAIIGILVEVLGQPKPPFSSIGDDVAYLPAKKGKLVIKSDMLVAKTDVPKGMELWQAARKSIVMCISDFAAKGVAPLAGLISLGIPRSFDEHHIRALAEGFRRAEEEFGIEILGGDTNEAEGLVIDCCMMGFADSIVRRRGAKPGDLVVTTGSFGYSSAGLAILLHGLKAEEGFRERAISSVVMPQPRLKIGMVLAKKRLPSASIDSSDGLALSLYELALQSRVGIEVENLPTTDEVIRFAKMNDLRLDELVLYGGEEFEIVATIPKDKLIEAERVARRVGKSIVIMGRVTKDYPNVILVRDGHRIKVERKGWVHLAQAHEV